jgi:hypothetical protein
MVYMAFTRNFSTCVIDALKSSHLNMTDFNYNVTFNDLAILKKDKIFFHYFNCSNKN